MHRTHRTSKARAPSLLRRLLAEARGAVATEYAIVIGVTAIVIGSALVTLGPVLLKSYPDSRDVLIAPVP